MGFGKLIKIALFLLASLAASSAQTVGCPGPSQCIYGVTPSGSWHYLALDANGNANLAVGAAAVQSPTSGCPSPGACPYAVGTDGLFHYLQVDANGNLEVSGTIGASGTAQTSSTKACESGTGISTLTAAYTTGVQCLPANSVIDAVVYRITTGITGTTTSFTVGDGTTAARFCAAQSTLTINTTGICFAQNWSATLAASGVQASAAAVKFTANGTITAGAMRLIVFYHTWTAPTS